MKNCFFCDSPTCLQAGIDGFYGVDCEADIDVRDFEALSEEIDEEEEDWYD